MFQLLQTVITMNIMGDDMMYGNATNILKSQNSVRFLN